MTNKELISEFKRWLNTNKPKVYIKSISHFKEDIWEFTYIPNWTSNTYYIVDDAHAEFRKLQIEKPDTQFQLLQYQEAGLDSNGEPKVKAVWVDCKPDWNLNEKYRIKPLEWYEDPNMIDKPIWVRDDDTEKWSIDIFLGYTASASCQFNCKDGRWYYAKPVKPEDLYQGE